MKYNKIVFLFFFIFLSIGLVSNYLTFKSYILQGVILNDFKTGKISLSYDKLKASNFDYPNINVFTIPLKAYEAYYLFNNKRHKEALDLLSKTDFNNINPYIKFENFIKANILLDLNQIDSAFFYAKSAYYSWPKSLQHYQLLNKISALKRDTTEIIKAFDLIDSIYYDRSAYQKSFIQSLAKAKLSYLVKYDSIRTLNSNEELYGSWKRVLEYEGGKIEYINNVPITFTKDLYYTGKDTLFYDVDYKSLNFYPISNKDYLLSTNKVYYSDVFKTLLIVPSQKNGNIQARYYKKVK